MNYKYLKESNKEEIVNLFKSTFSASEGENEGDLIGDLVSNLSSVIDDKEIICFGAYEGEKLIGSIFFTRLNFNQDIQIYMLAPVAISSNHQGDGVGQALINHGLIELNKRLVSVVITYGDPAFYSKVGFQSLSEDVIKAPLKLSTPEGWLGQSLSGENIPVINKRPRCVKEFNDPAYW